MMNELSTLVAAARADRLFPGCAWAVVTADQPPQFGAGGRWRYDETAPLITPDSIWDIASLTKSIPTASLALRLVEEGQLHLTDTLAAAFPAYPALHSATITLADLLQTGLTLPWPLSTQKHLSATELWTKIFTTPLMKPTEPTTPIFTNGPSIWLGRWLKQATGKKLSDLANEYFWTPLGMTDTTWAPLQRDQSYQERIVPTEVDPERGGELRGVVHDEGTWVLTQDDPGQLAVGAAGLFTSVVDLAKFAQMILSHGRSPAGRALFSTTTLALMAQGYGWETNSPWLGSHQSHQRFGKSGFTGCSIIFDLEKSISLILLTNAVHPQRPTNRLALNDWRQQMFNVLEK
jgi:CubicO group peptidase (beta-lactamase class C family)